MNPPLRIAPSILACDFAQMGAELQAMEAAGADAFHMDVMDGHFVPNLTFGPPIIKALRRHSKLPFDVHLMIAPVDPLLPEFAAAGADSITIQFEAGPHPHRSLQAIRQLGKKAGLALNPGTPVEVVDYLLPELDLVLVMSVNPGFGGQSFVASQLRKLEALRRRIDGMDHPIELQVDGGINDETAPLAAAAGADLLVAGTACFAGGPEAYAGNIARLREASACRPKG